MTAAGQEAGGSRHPGPVGDEVRRAYIPGPGEAWTPIRLTRWSGDYLAERGVENGRLDAELLLAHVLGVRRLDLYLQYDRPLSPEELRSFKALLKRRARREPLQYILGRVSFRELDLAVDLRALIPRPETEVLVEEVLRWAGGRRLEPAPGAAGGPDSLVGLDVGTGSGAIALSLLREGPFGRMVATDPSSEALELARENALRLGLAERLELRRGALFEPVRPHERFDVIVSNPPYIPEAELEALEPEVRDWEPREALAGGEDGLGVIRPLVADAFRFLAPGGILALEVGEAQAELAREAMEATGALGEVRVIRDLAGRCRVVLGVASGPALSDL